MNAKEQYIRQVKKALTVPRAKKDEILRDLQEAFDSALEHGETEQDGAVDYVRDFPDDGKYEIVWDFGSGAAFEEYIDTLHVQGYAEVAAASESASSGMLLEKDGVYLSIAYSGGAMNLLVMRETL